MNKIYKTLRNRRTGAMTAVSELRSSHVKGSRSSRLVLATALAAALALAASAPGVVEAASWTDNGSGQTISLVDGAATGGSSQIGKGFAFGNGQSALVYGDALTIGPGNYVLSFGSTTGGQAAVSLDVTAENRGSFFAQSQGFDQVLVRANGLTVSNPDSTTFRIDTGNTTNSNVFVQTLTQQGKAVANARYVTGELATGLKRLDEAHGGMDFGGYANGVRTNGSTLSTAAVLAEVELTNSATALELGVSGKQFWGAHLTGAGGITYTGENRRSDILTIGQIFESGTGLDDVTHLGGANDYTGATNLTKVTVMLERERSLGTGVLTADSARIVESTADAFGSYHSGIEFTNTILEAPNSSLRTEYAQFAGINTLTLAGPIRVVGTTGMREGSSIDMGTAEFMTGALNLNGSLTAGSVTTEGAAIAWNTSSVEATRFNPYSLVIGTDSSLNATGSLSVQRDVTLSENAELRAGVTSFGRNLSMANASINAESLNVQGALTLTGENTISTAQGATFNSDSALELAEKVSLSVTGPLVVNSALTVGAGGELNVTEDLSVAETLTIHEDANFNADSIAVGNALHFTGKNNIYGIVWGSNVRSADDTPFDLTLTKTSVRLNGTLEGVGKTVMNRATLTLAAEKAASLGDELQMSNGYNVLRLQTKGNYAFAENLTVVDSSPSDIIEFNGSGEVSFANTENIQGFDGWLRFVGTKLNLNVMRKLTQSPGVLVGRGGVLVLTGEDPLSVDRLGWSVDGSNPSLGVLDLSGIDFAKLEGPAILANQLVAAEGTIRLNASAVNGLDTGTDMEAGDSVFMALADRTGDRLVIEVAGESSSGDFSRIGIEVAGADNDTVTGAFDRNGFFLGNTSDTSGVPGAAAYGFWGYTSKLNSKGLTVSHDLKEIRLDGKVVSDVGAPDDNALTLEVDGASAVDVGVKISGEGDLVKTGSGTLNLLGTANTWSGTAYVAAGELVAAGGALGTPGADTTVAGLEVAEGATFRLKGAADAGTFGLRAAPSVQTVKAFEAYGNVEIGDDNSTSDSGAATLVLANGGTFYEGSSLTGGAGATLEVAGGTLTIEELENRVLDFEGTIAVGANGLLQLDRVEDGSQDPAKLGLLSGSGRVQVNDTALYGSNADFTGAIDVLEKGHLTFGASDEVAESTQLALVDGTVVSEGRHTFGSITVEGGTLELGTFGPEDDAVSGALTSTGNLSVKNATIHVSADFSDLRFDGETLLTVDDNTNRTVRLLTGSNPTITHVTITGVDTEGEEAAPLFSDSTEVGEILYGFTPEPDANGLLLSARADRINLWGELALTGSDANLPDPGSSSALDLEVTGVDPASALRIESGRVTLSRDNAYGALNLNEGTVAVLTGEQTLSEGGTIEGRLTGDGMIVLTGGVFDFASTASGDSAGIRIAATEGETAEVVFDGARTDPGYFNGRIDAESGALITFRNSEGDFALRSGTSDYQLHESSIITFANAAEGFASGAIDVDATSEARYRLAGRAGNADLAGVTGEGTVSLLYGDFGGELHLEGLDAEGPDAFTGTVGFENAMLTIGTDTTETAGVDAGATDFFTKGGSLVVGAGSTLFVANDKTGAGSGKFTPTPIEAGEGSALVLSNRAVLDFTTGVADTDDTFYGNTSGLSANAIDMQGGRVEIASEGTERLTVRAKLDALDLSSGLEGAGGKKTGSILDLLDENPSNPVLTLITDTGLDDLELATIAGAMELDTEGLETITAEFWQPDWTQESADPVHVADVVTGAGLVVDSERHGIAVGVGIREIAVRDGRTLRIDPSMSTGSVTSHLVNARIIGNETTALMLTNNLAAPAGGDLVLTGANGFLGQTLVDYGADVTVTSAAGLAESRLVRVGTSDDAAAGATLRFEVGTDRNPAELRTLQVGAAGTLELASGVGLRLTEGTSSFAAGSSLVGNEAHALFLASGASLSFEDYLDVTDEFKGNVELADGSTLTLTQSAPSGSDEGDAIDLSHVKGAGTVVLADRGFFDTSGDFSGTMRVLEHGHLNVAADAKTEGTVLALAGGVVVSEGEHAFGTITLAGGTMNLGTVTAGRDIATGALHSRGDLKLDGPTTLVVDSDFSGFEVASSGILTIDNVDGKTTWLLTGETVTGDVSNVTVDGIEETEGDETKFSTLVNGAGDPIGTVHHTLEAVVNTTGEGTGGIKGVGVKTVADSLDLTGLLELEGALDPMAQHPDTTLDLTVTGSKTGTIKVTNHTVTIDKANRYGALEVDRNASVVLRNTQTLENGGFISGTILGEVGLKAEGGTLTVDATGSDFTVEVGKGAELAFANRVGDPEIFGGAVTAADGSTVSFSGTSGNFNLASGTTDYVLSGASSVTFGPYASEADVKSAFAIEDAASTAHLDFTGAAYAIDLSGVKGAGTLALKYARSGGELNVTALNDAFTGTIAFTNAVATIGTHETLAASTLNAFATVNGAQASTRHEHGALRAGDGSVLRIYNAKDQEPGTPALPDVVKLARDLTISDRATLDFTEGLFNGSDEYLGNTSGVSVNALDMNGHRLTIIDSGKDNRVTFRAALKNIDLSSGFPDIDGDMHGSILDLMKKEGEIPPVLTFITGIDASADELRSIASDMQLEADETGAVPKDVTVEFWQPDWAGGSTGDPVHVADVTTGIRLVADEDRQGIAVGAGITHIALKKDATLRIDASVSETHASVLDATISGGDDARVYVTKSLGSAPADEVAFLAGNSYTGETVIDLGAEVTAGHAGAFAESKLVRVGSTADAGADFGTSTLTVAVTGAAAGDYANALRVKRLEAGETGAVALAEGNDLLLTGSGISRFAADATLSGETETTVGLAAGTLEFADPATALANFKGAFRVNSDARVELAIEGDYTWTNDVLYYTDRRARASGAGEFVKTGAGTLTVDGSEAQVAAMRLVAAEGTTHLRGFSGNASLLGLETRAGALVRVDGVFETQNLMAADGSIFALDVVTGKTKTLAEGETAEKDTVWDLGENGSDGIRVTGVARGTLNLAVTPADVEKGAEESILLADVAQTEDGNFTVNLVNANGAPIPALTAGAYDYTLVRRDDELNGTDIFLSSAPGAEAIHNTTVTAGSYLGGAAAAQLFDISLHDRMSNRSWLTANADGSIAASFWILETVSNERYGDSTGQIDVHDTASTTTVGSDILSGFAAGGTWYAGAMFSYATEDTKSRSNRTALDSRADTDAWAAGLYAGWQLNGADRTGPYVDGWILWTDAESDVKGGNVSETVDGNGLSASIEAGWGFKALSYNAHGQAGDIYVEPHVSVTWFGYEADDVSNDVHDVTFEGKDNIRTKLGVKTYAFGKNTGGFSPYVELNWIHNTETYGVTMSNVTVEQVGAEDQAEVRAGADWRITDSLSVWGHLGFTSGSDGYSNREGTLGLRYTF